MNNRKKYKVLGMTVTVREFTPEEKRQMENENIISYLGILLAIVFVVAAIIYYLPK